MSFCRPLRATVNNLAFDLNDRAGYGNMGGIGAEDGLLLPHHSCSFQQPHSKVQDKGVKSVCPSGNLRNPFSFHFHSFSQPFKSDFLGEGWGEELENV